MIATTLSDSVVALGTVRKVGDRQIWIEVPTVHGYTFIGRLLRDGEAADLRPGMLVLVAFDTAAPECLSFADDVSAVRAAELALV